jgi:hypothetical protein
MSVTDLTKPTTATTNGDKSGVRVGRQTIDLVLIGMGVIAAIVFAVAGGLLMWGSNFAGDYVYDELSSQNVVFPDADSRGAAQAVTDAQESGASPEEIAELQATANQLKAQRDSLFRGETLRGLLLSSFAWARVGEIAAIAAWVAFGAAAVMTGLVIAGIFHVVRGHTT